MDTIGTATLRQQIFAWALARFNKRYEQFAAQYKQKLFADLSGIVLEIGPGTGANLRYFAQPDVQWIGVEPNRFMKPYLEKEAKRLGMQIDCEQVYRTSCQSKTTASMPSSAHWCSAVSPIRNSHSKRLSAC